MQRHNIGKTVFGCLADSNISVSRKDFDLDMVPIKGCKCVLEANSEFSDHYPRIFQFFLILILGQMLITQASTTVLDVPGTLRVFENCGFSSAGQCLLIQGISNDFTQGMCNRPVFKDSLDI